MAKYDIVITTYETMRSEMRHVDLNAPREFRRRKRFFSFPSPLTCLLWWRLCLDEAQMIECPNTAAKLCRRIQSVYRWCVTGTPIQKSISDDLLGLCQFLGAWPLSDPFWFNAAMDRNSDTEPDARIRRLVSAVSPFFWRSAKKDVADQLCIPPQEQIELRFEFGAIEEHFYRRTRQHCLNEMRPIMNAGIDYNQKLGELDRVNLEKFMRPLLKLRQACIYPQSLDRISKLNNFNECVDKKLMSLEKVLDRMIRQTTTECTEYHRNIIACDNGSAGLKRLSSEIERKECLNEAKAIYLEILDNCQKNLDEYDIRTDSLQKIHTLHNLVEIFDQYESPDALNYRNRLELAESQYLCKTVEILAQRTDKFKTIKAEMEQDINSIGSNTIWWWEITRKCPPKCDIATELMSNLCSQPVIENWIEQRSIRAHFGLELALHNFIENALELRKSIVTDLTAMLEIDWSDGTAVQTAAMCHLRRDRQIGSNDCSICKASLSFVHYEFLLFERFDEELAGPDRCLRPNADSDTNPNLTRADSLPLRILRAVFNFFNRCEIARQLFPEILQVGRNFSKFLTRLKDEAVALRLLWMAISDNVAARDEMALAKTRYQWRNVDDVDGNKDANLVFAFEVEPKLAQLNDQRLAHQTNFRQKLGQLHYLRNLRTSGGCDAGQSATSDAANDCPVCHNRLRDRWSLLACAHSLCLNCASSLALCSHGSIIKCPVCRQSQTKNMMITVTDSKCSLSYDVCSAIAQSEFADFDSNFKIQGSFSTKIEAICRRLMAVLGRIGDNAAKILVFSHWPEVLAIVGQALAQNNTKFTACYSQSKKHVVKSLDEFRKSTERHILLIPIAFGANGLNIVEATHIFLVEPTLNRSVEQQVLGRVHRIGQTRPTFVHKFIIKGTVEEELVKILSDRQTAPDESPLTVRDFFDFIVD